MVSNGIKMEFGVEKCAKASYEWGIQLPGINTIQELEIDVTNTYLIIEGDGAEHQMVKVRSQKEYKWGIKLAFTLAVPVLTYSY